MKNGSAVEAAITTALCSGLVHPHSCGIGGGFFMVAYDRRSGNSTAVDAREVAPLAATELMYVNTSNPGISSVKGWHAAGVPGTVRQYSFYVCGESQQSRPFALIRHTVKA